MTFNYEVFQRDLSAYQIPNDGVAKIGMPQDDKAWDVLRYELENFVCEGNYRSGLVRVLRSFLDQLDRELQPAVWVSGFFGSGKSHFARVLEYLWRDLRLPDGATARSLVNLPDDVRELFIELSSRAHQAGGLWSAAGTLQSGSQRYVRLAILGIMLNSAGLPTSYAQARLMLWLQEKGYADHVKHALEQQQLDLDSELSDMYVSTPLADAILEVMPDFAKSNPDARDLLQKQFSSHDDVNSTEMLALMKRIMRLNGRGQRGELPYTLIVLDELQQYLGGDTGSTAIQQVIEDCSSHFKSRLLFVATGQSAITANSAMQKLQARFTVHVELSDQDVDQVVRKVVLRKRPERVAELQQLLNQQSGEIDRQLRGTRIGPTATDRADLVASYPLLPTRRRFWEVVLRAVDSGGTTGMLRTQLRIVLEAVKATAQLPLGHVIPADFIFDQQRSGMSNSNVLSNDYTKTIDTLKATTTPLAARLAALIFLIDRLDRDGPLATGLTPTAETLTDLLVEDLSAGHAALQQAVNATLSELCDAGTLLRIDDSYHLQTRESATWNQAYSQQLKQIGGDEPRLESERRDALQRQVGQALRGATIVKVGKSKTDRRGEPVFSTTAPSLDADSIPMWVRDGWEVGEAAVIQAARELGEDSPIITIFLPKRDADALREVLARHLAAAAAANELPPPQSDSGREAKQAMESRRDTAKKQLDQQLQGVLEHAIVIQGGGNVIDAASLAEMVREALSASAQRRYPDFIAADHLGWGAVFDRARDGAEDALQRVDYSGEPQSHPVCHAILDFIGGEAPKGDAVRKHFAAPPFGWPQEVVDAALVVLVRSGHVRVMRDGQTLTVKQITHPQIGQTVFQREGVTISTLERLAIRKLLQDIGVPVQAGSEGDALDTALAQLRDLARQAGGTPPVPAVPTSELLDALQAAHGNERLKLAAMHAADILPLQRAWEQRRDTIQQRLPRWQQLELLLRHAQRLPGAAAIAPQAAAIREQRLLLAEPDPVPPLVQAVAGTLRQALRAVVDRQAQVFAAEDARLRDLAEWRRLPEDQRAAVLSDQRLSAAPAMPEIGTEAQLLAALDALPLAQRQTEIDALPQRFAAAKAAASRLLEPKVTRVRPETATLRTRQEVEDYTAALRDRLLRQLESGPIFVEGA